MPSPYDLAPTGMGDGAAIVQWLRAMMDRRRAQEPNAPYVGSYRGRLTPDVREEYGFPASEPPEPSAPSPTRRQPDYMSGVTKTEPSGQLALGTLPQLAPVLPEPPPYEPPGQPAPPERAPLQFAWGGGTPQDYRPGETDIYAQPGAPSMTQGFMPAGGTRSGFMEQRVPGASGGVPLPVAQRQSAGGVGAAPWEDVANPVGMPGYEESIAQAMAERDRKDPTWREKAATDEQIRANEAIMRAQSAIAEAARARQIDRALAAEKAAAVDRIRLSPEYAGATPEHKKLMEAESASTAEASLLKELSGARTSYDITPDLPRASPQRLSPR